MDERRWVSAEPFRAHLNHVCASAGVGWAVVAANAGLPLGLVRDLLDVRPGRRVVRIAPELARQVLAISAQDVAQLRVRMVSARVSGRLARRLLTQGWSVDRLAAHLRVSHSDATALVRGTMPHVSALTHCRLTAVAMAQLGSAATPARTSAEAA